jgi:K+-transporting ATPase KdpF subunit
MVISCKEAVYGRYLSHWHFSVLHPAGCPELRLRKAGRHPMSGLTLIISIVAVALLLYLIAALLHPEDFS